MQHNLPFLFACSVSEHISRLKNCDKCQVQQNENQSYFKQDHETCVKGRLSYMTEHAFTLIIDGSSDSGLKKLNAICVYVFDVKRSKQVECKFFGIRVTSGEGCSKADTLFKLNQRRFRKGLDWLGLSCKF